MEAKPVKIREPKASDLNFIQSTFLKSMKRESHLGRSCSSQVFFSEFPKVIDYILDRSKTLIAHFDEEPDLILGYIIYELECAHYVYVKAPYRGHKIGWDLIHSAFPESKTLTFTLNTKASKKYCEQYSNLIHNPFFLFKKGIT